MKAKTISGLLLVMLTSVFLFGPIAGIAVFAALNIVGRYALLGQPLTGFMAVVAYTPCTDVTSTQTAPGDCIEEGSAIVGFLLVKKGFNITTAITDPTTYAAAKTARDVIPVKDLEAYWPAPAQQTIPGVRGRMERHGHWQFEMPFKHEGVDANLNFWNTVTQSRNYGVCLITEEYKAFMALDRQLEPVMSAISAAPASDQEYGKTRFIQGTVKWKHKDLPYHIDTLTSAILQPDFQV